MSEVRAEGGSLSAIGGSALILMGSTFVVQAIGIGRELYLAARLGVSAELDALIIGLALPTALAGVLVAGARTALVPTYMEHLGRSDRQSARRLAGAILVQVALVSGVVTVALIVLAPVLVVITGPGLSPADREDAARYLRLVAPTTALMAVMNIFMAVLQAERRFKDIAMGSIVGPVATLVVMVALWDRLSLDSLAIGTVVGALLSVVTMAAFALRHGLLPRPALAPRGIGVRSVARHALPLSLSAAILQLNPIVDRAVASIVAPGAVSALRYADSILRAPTAAIVPALGAAAYPAFVATARDHGEAALGAATERGLRLMIAVFLPVTMLTAAVAPVAVATVYGRGVFTADDVRAVAQVLVAFAPLVVVLVADEILTTALNARRSGVLLLVAGTANVVLNALLDVVLGLSLGVAGIALSSSITVFLVAVWKARALESRLEGFGLASVGRAIGLTFLCALPGVLVAAAYGWIVYRPSDTITGLLTLLVLGLWGVGAYLLAARLLRHEAPLTLVRYAWQRVR